MAYHITHTNGAMENCPPLSSLVNLLNELETADAEHGEVALTHESEWCLSVSRSGFVVFENLEAGNPRHMKYVSRDKIIDLCSRLASGDVQSLHAETWVAGYR